ncbi:MAG: cytochrome c3 family protein [Ignavibacteria bacterium]
MQRVILGVLIFTTLISAQNNKNHSFKQTSCKSCHSCDVPTKQDPCLLPCPREDMVTVHQSAVEGPEAVKLDQLSDKYMPVVFSHKIHAQMSQMSGGCIGCHHYNTAGPVLPCSDCHSVERKREDISKPDLQAAFHRQCINCHKEWSHSTDCTSCHELKGSNGNIIQQSEEKLKGKEHPKVEEPQKLVYETNYNKGKIVTFFHDEHVNKFNADCISCHQKENCSKCHDKGRNLQKISSSNQVKISKSKDDHHQPCFKCHEQDKCSKCHMDNPMKPFNHKISTGWALNKFHEKFECIKCHKNSKFVKLNNSCTSCHNNFTAGFNHNLAGLKLDEIHAELECSDCHAENDFSKLPECSNCHDDKSFPKDKPGKLIKITKK